MSVSLVVLTLNEIDGLKSIMPSIPQGLFSQILILDGNSKDGSADWAKSQGYDVYIQKEKGIRKAYLEGWNKITSPYVVTFSPDGNCKTEDLSLLVDKLKSDSNDMVIASRYKGGIKSEDDSFITAFGNWMFTTLINVLHGGHYTDAMTIYRGYRTNLFYELDLHKEESYWVEKMFSTVIGIEPLLSIRAAKAKMKIDEIPSLEPKRIYGKRKLQIIRWGASYLTQVFLEFFSWKPKK